MAVDSTSTRRGATEDASAGRTRITAEFNQMLQALADHIAAERCLIPLNSADPACAAPIIVSGHARAIAGECLATIRSSAPECAADLILRDLAQLIAAVLSCDTPEIFGRLQLKCDAFVRRAWERMPPDLAREIACPLVLAMLRLEGLTWVAELRHPSPRRAQ